MIAVSVVNGVMLWKFSTVLFKLMAPKGERRSFAQDCPHPLHLDV